MKFSIIIPVYNAEATLRQCLDAVFAQELKDFEVIAVDNGSIDASASIIKDYPCKPIFLNENKGAACARNIGAEYAQGEILVFVDSDIVVRKGILATIEKSFREDSDIVAATGILAKECAYKDFFSTYKNLYMHYIYRKCNRYVNFIYSSIAAILKSNFLKFNEELKMGEDTELGQRYAREGKRIFLNTALEVSHLKKYNLITLIKNDFLIPFWWVKTFLLYGGLNQLMRQRRFAHSRLNQILAILISYMLTISPFFMDYRWSLILSIVFLILLNDFFIFLYRSKGLIFLIKAILFTYIDALVMGAGIIAGFIVNCIRLS
jgi:glycosyltransferase involved in cell wall biosynthesis